MIKPYIQKIIFIDDDFLYDLKHKSITIHKSFNTPTIDTKVITLSEAESSIDELISYVSPSEIQAGRVLAKAGYSNQFVPIDTFSENQALRKYNLLVLLGITLGAKKIKLLNIESSNLESNEQSSLNIQAKAKVKIAQGEIGVKNETSEHNKNLRKAITSINAEAEGGKPDLEEAKKILEKYNLHQDDIFQNIYDLRSLSTNTLRKHKLSLDLSTDISRVFDSSMQAKVKAMSLVYAGQAEFDKIKKSFESEQNQLSLSVEIEF